MLNPKSKMHPSLFPCTGRYLPPLEDSFPLTRRQMLARAASGFGGLALASILAGRPAAHASTPLPGIFDLSPKSPHLPPKAKNVIFLYMGGGPAQMDLFDPKPMLQKYDGQPIPMSITQRDVNPSTKLMASPFTFKKYGASGIEVSELLPNIATLVDDLAVVRSAFTNRIDHGEASLRMYTGRPISGFPSIGSWLTYGLGTENEDMPAFVTMADKYTYRVRNAISNAWLPALYQGTLLNPGGTPILNLKAPSHMSKSEQRSYLDLTQALNRRHQETRRDLSELDARIKNFELAARMQVEAVERVDLTKESPGTRQLYGLDREHSKAFGSRCLIARRLVESGVRFVLLFQNDWDHHTRLKANLTKSCAQMDHPVAGLIKDLKARGLFDETLLVWTGEFGRLPVVEASDGRDHNPFGFSMWMAGAGIKGGTVYGATDDFAYAAVEDRVGVPDIHATILHLLGLDHKELTFPFEGRDESLTGVEEARVVREILA